MRTELEALAQRARLGRLDPTLDMHRVSPAMSDYRQAAVLALFTPTLSLGRGAANADGLDMFFVQRSLHLSHHPGQIALPGGGIDPGESPEAAAVRETYEEAGVPSEQIQVLGNLGQVAVPISGNIVSVVLGWADTVDQVGRWDEAEVQHPLRVPVSGLLDAGSRAQVDFFGHSSAGFSVQSGWIWGFTGNLVDYLFTELGWSRSWDTSVRHRLTFAEAHGGAPAAPGADVAPTP